MMEKLLQLSSVFAIDRRYLVLIKVYGRKRYAVVVTVASQVSGGRALIR